MATLSLVLLTTLVSVIALRIRPTLLGKGMLRPYRVRQEGTWYELVTSGFLHASFGHLFLNMFVLFFFGMELEHAVGPIHLFLLYLTGLLASSIPSILKFSDDPGYATLGASGAVGSILFGFIFLFPTENLYLILLPIPIPAWLFGILYLIYSMYESRSRRGKVNHEAHIAGAVWGLVYMILFVPGSLTLLRSFLE